MPKILIFYWEPGSGGDFVNRLLLERPLEYQGVHDKFTLTDQGRFIPSIINYFTSNFSSEHQQWYNRTWTESDCAKVADYVLQLKCNWFVIPTHRSDQIVFLKSQFKNSYSMGITYPDHMFPLVLKNVCKKVLAFDTTTQEIYNQSIHKYLQDKKKFGEFVLWQQLIYGTKVKRYVEDTFDIALPLEDLYNLELYAIKSLFQNSKHVDDLFTNWFHNQSNLHSYSYDIPKTLQQALGYNSRSIFHGDLSLHLDTFDNILIKHYFNKKNIPSFKTLQQAADFFKDHSNIL
jgi:hypothetical protein